MSVVRVEGAGVWDSVRHHVQVPGSSGANTSGSEVCFLDSLGNTSPIFHPLPRTFPHWGVRLLTGSCLGKHHIPLKTFPLQMTFQSRVANSCPVGSSCPVPRALSCAHAGLQFLSSSSVRGARDWVYVIPSPQLV